MIMRRWLLAGLILCILGAPMPVRAQQFFATSKIVHLYVIYGQSWAQCADGAARGFYYGTTINLYLPALSFMTNQNGAPCATTTTQEFNNPSRPQVSALVPIQDGYKPLTYTGPSGQSLASALTYLQSLDAARGRGIVNRGFIAAGVFGRPMSTLGKPATRTTSCTMGDVSGGIDCWCYSAGACVYAYNQMLDTVQSFMTQATARGWTTQIEAVGWLQGWADSQTSAASYQNLLGTSIWNPMKVDLQAITGQTSPIRFVIEQVLPASDGSFIPPAVGEKAFIDANADGLVTTTGPQYYRHFSQSTSVTLTGAAPTPGDVPSITFTSAGITGSPVTVSYTVQGGDTTTTIATALTNAINANANLIAAAANATAGNNVISINIAGEVQPGPTIAFNGTASVSGSVVYAPAAAHEFSRDVVWKAEQFGQCFDKILQALPCPVLESSSVGKTANSIVINYSVPVSPLVVDTSSVPAATNDGYALSIGVQTTGAATTTGALIHFTVNSMPPYVVAPGGGCTPTTCLYVTDLTNPGAIPAGTQITAVSTNTATMSNNVTGTIGNGDLINFSTCNQTISGTVSVGASAVTIPTSGDPTGCTVQYAMSGPGMGGTTVPLTGYAGGYGNIRDSYCNSGCTPFLSGFVLRNFAMSEQWVVN